jgi:hypothetical protein
VALALDTFGVWSWRHQGSDAETKVAETKLATRHSPQVVALLPRKGADDGIEDGLRQ